MKKQILTILAAIVVCSMSLTCVEAKDSADSTFNSAIKMYKANDYSQCYVTMQKVVETDPSNALAYYYLAMSAAQIGNKEEAISNYEKVINLASDEQLLKYASKGKTCLEMPAQCHADVENMSPLDKFIFGEYGTGFSAKVRSDYEKHKIENLMREMNRGKDVEPKKFKDYKDFSTSVPTDEEIVAALRVLQRAGFGDLFNSNRLDMSLLTGNYSKNSNAAILNMLTENGNSTISPQMIQSLLTNQMSIGF